MPPTPKVSPVTGKPVNASYLHADSINFRDSHGRSVVLHGVNLSGSSKAPPQQPGERLEGFWEEAEAGGSENWFGNHPLDLEDGSADVHLARLRAWGFNMIRYVFTWEALEHAGPGKYDYEYMDYVIKVLVKCKDYGFRVFMDPHQDVWSRFSGGSGAPLWTLYACGIDPRNITATTSAVVYCEYPSPSAPDPASTPSMLWSTNYARLLSQTVFTLFYGGKDYAPKCIIDGVNIQEYLQSHFINAVGELAKRIRDSGEDLYDSCVVGWDSMNEPSEGLIGHHDITQLPKTQALKKGPTPTAYDGLKLGMGMAVEVDNWDFGAMGPKRAGRVLLDPKGVKLWLKPEEEETRGGGKWGWKRDPGWQLGTCVWGQHGVWDPKSTQVLNREYFASVPSDPSAGAVDYVANHWRLHWLEYSSKVRQYHAEAIHFIQPPVFKQPPPLPKSHLQNRACSAPHYYDGLTLITKHWNWFNADALGVLRGKYWTVVQALKIGEPAIRNCIQSQLGILKDDTQILGNFPTLIGEIGIPYDMDHKKAYGYTDEGKYKGDYSAQTRAMDCSLNAADGPNVLNWTVWTYCPDHSHQWSDRWNGEDLSLWSADDQTATPIGEPAGSGTMSMTSSSYPSSTTLASSTKSKLTPRDVSPEAVAAGQVKPSLLLDGARAVGAFCRPFPTATVGHPKRLDFDIKSSTFKLVVRVSAGDEASDDVMTEIYLPYVHYAANLGLRDSELEDYVSRSLANSKANLLESSSPSPRSTFASPVLDVDVTISTGRFETSGQTLKWWYKPPLGGSMDVEITVKRKGGAINWEQSPDSSKSSWTDICPQECLVQ